MPQGLTRHRHARVSALTVGVGLVIGLLGVGPVAAETDTADQRATRAQATSEVRPTAERPERPERPERDLEVLQLACSLADGETETADSDAATRDVDDASDGETRVHIGCRWRAAVSERAAGYQLWRIVDRGERELVARGGLDLLGARDVVASSTHLVRYAVIAVDENGNRVGQSRVQRVVVTELDDHDRRLAARARNAELGGR